MNKVILIGRLVADPQLRYTQTGNAVASFRIAVDRPFSQQKETDFIDCVAWKKLAENLASYTAKGSLVALEGRLQIRTYQAKDGTNRKVAEVVADSVKFLEKKHGGQSANDFSDFDAGELDPNAPF